MFVGTSAASDNQGGASVAGWHAEDIVVDYFESEDWAALDESDEPEPDADAPESAA